MTEEAWRAQRDSRSIRYAGRVLDTSRPVLVRADAEYAARYDGQVAILTAANLLGRMTPSVALDIPSVPMAAPLPWAGDNLPRYLLDRLFGADPYGRFEIRGERHGDYVVHLGRTGAAAVVHGTGWNLYAGPAPSPLPFDDTTNPIGPAIAAILATAEAFRSELSRPAGFQLNALYWQNGLIDPTLAPLVTPPPLGRLWTVGTGSVGTAILYFLTLVTRAFSPALFDMDEVKIHNLDRSPIFTAEQVGMKKVAATADYLAAIGVVPPDTEAVPLDESAAWRNRPQGVPDILVSAANERNVRAVIENGFPPIQIYGTTGRNWQAAMVRHVPLEDPCSCCLFPETGHAATICAGGSVTRSDGQQIDAALPFLSFAAGAMAAAEILKLRLPGYPFTPNRVVLNTAPTARAIHAPLSLRPGCICRHRSRDVHRLMIAAPARTYRV